MAVSYFKTKVKDYGNGVQQFIQYQNPVRTGFTKPYRPRRDYEAEIDETYEEVLKGTQSIDKAEKQAQAIMDASKHNKKSNDSRAKQKIYDLAQCNSWEWFITLTFSPEKINRQDYKECCKAVKYFLDETRRISNGDFKYLGVPEYHDDGVSYHFHFIFCGISDTNFTYSHSDGIHEIYNLAKYPFGWSTGTRVRDTKKLSGYITKYITKTITNNLKGKKRYWASRNLNMPIEYTFKESIDMIYLPIPTYSHEIKIDTQRYKNVISYDIIDFNIKPMEVSE